MKTPIPVWRYERPDGDGPYRWDAFADDLRRAHNKDIGRPGPNSDGLGFVERNQYCGMNSKEGLIKWFWGFNRRLKREGYRIKKYLAEEYRVSLKTGQVVFEKPKGRIV